MSKTIANNPQCVGCNRTIHEVPGMFVIRKGGLPTHICWDCIDELHAKAWIERNKEPRSHLRLIESVGD
jgi:hypothetical protein